MTAYLLAIIPSVILLINIYRKDKIEKEPGRLLFRCFVFGALMVFPAGICESIIGDILDIIFSEGSLIKAFVDYYCVVGLCEELFKYLILILLVSKSKEYDCMFDGIVYAVFISLGFATLENMYYVVDGGIGTAILRMFTSIPGHMVFAVYMGYFYSKYKYSKLKNDRESAKSYECFALLVPVLLHGTYDFLISVSETRATDFIIGLAFLIWLVFVLTIFIITYVIVDQAARSDEYIVSLVYEGKEKLSVQRGTKWVCSCHRVNYGNYCSNCGKRKPQGR